METKLSLNQETLEALQSLIEANLDSAKCLEEASEAIDHDHLARYFAAVAAHRLRHATELQSYVAANFESPETTGTFSGDLRKMWINFRSVISGGDAKAMLSEAEAAEDVIKAKYEDLLIETAGSAMNDVLMRHIREVKIHHDQIRELRDAA